ncbi:MAG: TraB/GumN family protein [Novosphingobium sp.]
MTKLFRLLAIWTALLFASLSVTAPAREAAQPAVRTALARPAPVRATLVRPALWKISDHDTTIYLFGTIHALPKGVNWFGGPVASAFNTSDELVTEIAGSDATDVQALTSRIALLPPGETLRATMSASDREAFEGALAFNGLAADAYDRFEPWFAAVALSNLPLMKAGYDPSTGVEATLDARAKALKRPHIGLETPEYQLGLFDALPAETQKAYLNEIVEHTPTIAKELIAIVDEWKRGNAEKLAELMNADEDDPYLVAVLLTNRNHAWAQWIKDRMDRPGKVFVAVGAGHIAGRGSLLDQLHALGFTATRLQ